MIAILSKIRFFLIDYCERHANPFNAALHLIGVPMVVIGLYGMFSGHLAGGAFLFVLGYFLQYLGHRAQGNEVGEVTLIKHIWRKIFPPDNRDTASWGAGPLVYPDGQAGNAGSGGGECASRRSATNGAESQRDGAAGESRRALPGGAIPDGQADETAGGAVCPVVVDGATGYVGNHLVSLLCAAAVPVRCIVREGANHADVQFLQSCGAEVFTGEWGADSPSLTRALSGVKQVVHLIGSIAPPRGETLAQLHVDQTRALIDKCVAGSVAKVIMVTAVGTAGDANNNYHSTKWQAEECLRASGLNFVIVRPSLIVGQVVGRRDSKLVSRYRRLVREKRSVPLIAGGANLVQPIFVGDLSCALAAIVRTSRFDRRTIELGGAEVVTMRTFVERLMSALDCKKPVSNIPVGLARIAAVACQAIQMVPLISWDQVTLATTDNICADNMLDSIVSKVTGLDEALETYREASRGESTPRPQLTENVRGK